MLPSLLEEDLHHYAHVHVQCIIILIIIMLKQIYSMMLSPTMKLLYVASIKFGEIALSVGIGKI